MSDRISPTETPSRNQHISSALGEVVTQHQTSQKRDGDDVATDRTYPAIDGAARNTFQSAVDVDNQLLFLARAGKPIPQDLIKSALKTHGASNADAVRDRSADNAALAQDAKDIKAERRVIDSDNALLRAANITPDLRAMMQADIASKHALMANEQRDYGNEAVYVKHDIAEIAANARVLKALNGNRADLIPALEKSRSTKFQAMLDRGEDQQLEPQHAAADIHDREINTMLLNALKDPCIYNSLFQPRPTKPGA